MFPQYQPQINEGISEEATSNGKSFLFDFSQGDFNTKDGKMQIVEGIAALKIWIEKILKTEKFRFKIYETGVENQYGVTLLEMVNSGHPQVFIQAEIQREITEALLRNTAIISVTNFTVTRDKRTMQVSFDVNSIYGDMAEEVIF